ncbi:MAG: hypothetical protein WCG90_06335 [Chitinophagia bacterium]
MRKQAIRSTFLICLAPILMGFYILPQGIKGHVLLEENATMPFKGKAQQKGRPISTTVYIYEAANVNQLVGQEGNYAKGLEAKIIKQVRSDDAGKFKLRLAPGKYSIVLGYQEGIYIPYFSGNEGVAFIEVLTHQWQEIDLTIIASSVY